MSLKGNYLTGNLACQNLGDCSFCFVPTIVEDKADEKKEQKRTEKQNIVQKLFKKS